MSKGKYDLGRRQEEGPRGQTGEGSFPPSASEFSISTGPSIVGGPQLHDLDFFPVMTLDADGCQQDTLQKEQICP